MLPLTSHCVCGHDALMVKWVDCALSTLSQACKVSSSSRTVNSNFGLFWVHLQHVCAVLLLRLLYSGLGLVHCYCRGI